MKLGFLYLLFSFPRFVFKIGVTKYPKRRVKNINESINRQIVIPVCMVLVWNYESKEERLHDIFNKERFTFRGSGKTEYFKLNVFQFLAVLGLMLFYQVETVFRFSVLVGLVWFIVWIIK